MVQCDRPVTHGCNSEYILISFVVYCSNQSTSKFINIEISNLIDSYLYFYLILFNFALNLFIRMISNLIYSVLCCIKFYFTGTNGCLERMRENVFKNQPNVFSIYYVVFRSFNLLFYNFY
jgi:hypothetical protein